METVAIVTGGDIRRGVGLAEQHRLAVICFPVCLQPVFMALAATLVAQGFEIIAGRVDDLMRAVAVNAHRAALVALGQQLAMDTLVVGFLNAHMAFAASLGDIRVVDGRIAVHGCA